MQFVLLCLSAFAVQAGRPGYRPLQPRPVSRSDYDFITNLVGGPHGDPFNDLSFTEPPDQKQKRIKSVTLAPCGPGEHVTYMKIDFSDFAGGKDTFVEHGKRTTGSKDVSVTFDKKEQRISQVRLTTWKAKVGMKHHTRVGWIELTTGKGIIACGAKYDDDHIHEWQGNDLDSVEHFGGQSGDAIDSLRGFFIKNSEY